jgi:hypothetical protein
VPSLPTDASHRTTGRKSGPRRGRAVVTGLLASALVAGSVGAAAAGTNPSPANQVTGASTGVRLNAAALQRVLDAQALPTLTYLPTTATSHPWNSAATQNVPIDLAAYGFVEKEYLVSGQSNVYDWVAGSNYDTKIIGAGPYTTRMDVRRPANMKKWSGRVVVEIINMSAGYDWTANWSALWQTIVKKNDVYIGITSKPNVFDSLKSFDPTRYAAISMANPVPAAQQACGTSPGDANYDPNLSKLYENGLIWDVLTQVGRLTKSKSSANPLGRAASRVYLAGESQSSNFLATYYKWFTPAATLSSGKPVYDGMLSETIITPDSTPINQCAKVTDPLPAGDAQVGSLPGRSVPWMGLSSQWDYAAARGVAAYQNSNTATNKARFWELAGANHGWKWQYDYGDANAEDLARAGFPYPPSSYDWQCTVNNPEVPFEMVEKAAYEALDRWVTTKKAPPIVAPILSKPNDPGIGEGVFRDAPVYDGLGNAMGGLRMPMVAVPVAAFGMGEYALTGTCPNIVPFSPQVLGQLYTSKADYVAKYSAATRALVRDGFLLREDGPVLIALARQVTSIPNSHQS